LLRARHHHADACRAKAAADARIISPGPREIGNSPLEGCGLLAGQEHAVDAEARRFGLGNALRGRGRGDLWALIDRAFVLLAQGALAF
jgi:hypothetical protein